MTVKKIAQRWEVIVCQGRKLKGGKGGHMLIRHVKDTLQ